MLLPLTRRFPETLFIVRPHDSLESRDSQYICLVDSKTAGVFTVDCWYHNRSTIAPVHRLEVTIHHCYLVQVLHLEMLYVFYEGLELAFPFLLAEWSFRSRPYAVDGGIKVSLL